jgi:hypothetical protein
MARVLTDTQQYNMEMATRQLSMNDYAYQNKMDTLFFFQILLLSILILCVFAYGARMGFFSDALVIYIGVILILINTVIFIGRYAYTVNLRDPNVWSRRRFIYQEPNPAAPPVTLPQLSFARFGLRDISGVDVPGLCKAAGY